MQFANLISSLSPPLFKRPTADQKAFAFLFLNREHFLSLSNALKAERTLGENEVRGAKSCLHLLRKKVFMNAFVPFFG